jgi:Flp pilus assembly protein TadD
VLALASKEVAVVAPLLLLLYDRCFLAGSLRAALRARTSVYASLALIWLLLLVLVFGEALFREGSSAGFGVREITPLQYAATQPQVVLHYLRLAVWPHPLCLDYGWPPASDALEILLPGVALLALLVVGLRLLQRHSALGFLVTSFFLLLVPSSSFLPIRDLAAEHRMYLPLVPIVLLAVLAAADLLERVAGGRPWVPGVLVAAFALVLTGVTVIRNADYSDAVRTWSRVVEQAPKNPRGHLNLGLAHQQRDELEPALQSYRKALLLKPDYAEVHNNLGALLSRRGEPVEAMHHLRSALENDPRHTPAHVNIARLLLSLDRTEEAIGHLRQAVEIDPFDPTPHHSLGVTLAHVGKVEEAMAELERALELDPGYEQARVQLESLRHLRE